MILSVATQKGGAGKTTTSVSLAAGIARKGKKTLLIDIDYQANATQVLLPGYETLIPDQTLYTSILDRKPLPIHPTNVVNLDIVPSHILLSSTDVELTAATDHREERLKRQLDQISNRYEYVLLDCPPSLGWLTINAFTASDRVLVVVSPGRFELQSLTQISKTLNRVTEDYNLNLKSAGFVFVMSDATLNSKTSLSVLRQTYPDLVLKTVIPRNTDIRDAHWNRQDIFKFNPKANSAIAYEKLIQELFGI